MTFQAVDDRVIGSLAGTEGAGSGYRDEAQRPGKTSEWKKHLRSIIKIRRKCLFVTLRWWRGLIYCELDWVDIVVKLGERASYCSSTSTKVRIVIIIKNRDRVFINGRWQISPLYSIIGALAEWADRCSVRHNWFLLTADAKEYKGPNLCNRLEPKHVLWGWGYKTRIFMIMPS